MIKFIEKYGFAYFVICFICFVLVLLIEDKLQYHFMSWITGIMSSIGSIVMIYYIVKNIGK